MRRIIFALVLTLLLTAVNNTQAQSTSIKDAIIPSLIASDYRTNHLPDGSDETFSDYKLWEPGWSVAYGRNLNKFINLNIPLHARKSPIPNRETTIFEHAGSVLFGLDAIAHIGNWENNGNWFKPYLLAGFGATYIEGLDEVDLAIPLGAGLNFRLGKKNNWNPYLTIQTQYRYTFEENRRNFNHSIGFMIPLGEGEPVTPPVIDSDGDGISDAMDKCPGVAGLPNLGGCPDSDSDGIADGDDKCPNVAGIAAFEGCPDSDNDGVKDSDDQCPNEAGLAANNGCPIKDADSDGVVDADDKCPNEAGPASNNGCPILDKDGDGVLDAADNCPNESGPAENAGCPYPDRDNDGVLDKDDRCPDKAGTTANFGCPEIKVEDKETLNFAAQNIYFDTGKSRIKSTSFEIMDKVADILNRYPDYNCSIGGHTDSVGNAASNQRLSESRAKACRDYLTSKGISSSRLTYTGYGETQPIADNKYKDGREQNRRVEFNVYLK